MVLTTGAHRAHGALIATMMSSAANNLRAAAMPTANASVLRALEEMTAPNPFATHLQMARTGLHARAISASAKMDGRVSIATSVPQTMPVMP